MRCLGFLHSVAATRLKAIATTSPPVSTRGRDLGLESRMLPRSRLVAAGAPTRRTMSRSVLTPTMSVGGTDFAASFFKVRVLVFSGGDEAGN